MITSQIHEEISDVCHDPDDNHILACAHFANPDYLVIGEDDSLVSSLPRVNLETTSSISMKGYGFLSDEDQKDYFCHFTDCDNCFRDSRSEQINLIRNQVVEFDPEQTEKGLKAVNIRKLQREATAQWQILQKKIPVGTVLTGIFILGNFRRYKLYLQFWSTKMEMRLYSRCRYILPKNLYSNM